MHIKLKKKYLYYSKYKAKCSIGKRGIADSKVEGDNKTPRGSFKIISIFYRKDRIQEIKTDIKKRIIEKNMGWCDDVRSKFYNKLIRFPFRYSAEKLYLKNNIYDVILILDYNIKKISRGRGSAIFIHLAKKKYLPTKGCIALSYTDMKLLIQNINKKSKITIY